MTVIEGRQSNSNYTCFLSETNQLKIMKKIDKYSMQIYLYNCIYFFIDHPLMGIEFNFLRQ